MSVELSRTTPSRFQADAKRWRVHGWRFSLAIAYRVRQARGLSETYRTSQAVHFSCRFGTVAARKLKSSDWLRWAAWTLSASDGVDWLGTLCFCSGGEPTRPSWPGSSSNAASSEKSQTAHKRASLGSRNRCYLLESRHAHLHTPTCRRDQLFMRRVNCDW